MTIPEELDEFTYAIQHNPNCEMPFLVRLVGRGSAVLDYLGKSKTNDILGWGITCDQAADNALAARIAQYAIPLAGVIKHRREATNQRPHH